MKKALALVLALVLALSMGVSAFAADFVVLEKDVPSTEDPAEITVVDFKDVKRVLYTTAGFDFETLNPTYGTKYYVALDTAVPYTKVELTANGNVSAKLVEFNPETMILVDENGNMLTYSVLAKGENVGVNVGTETEPEYLLGDYTAVKANKTMLEAYYETVAAAEKVTGAGKSGYPALVGGCIPTTGLDYTAAKLVSAFLAKYDRVTFYSVECEQYVNVIEITVDDNFSASYTEGTLKIKAYNVADKKTYSGELAVINDVTIFEYEEVKYAAENNAKGAALQLGALGYSDAITAENGYSHFADYDSEELRNQRHALVVSTTAFRAIEGKDLTLNVATYVKGAMPKALADLDINVTLKEIAAGQKGVNFFAWAEVEGLEYDEEDGLVDRYPSAVSFGFLGNQIVKGKFEINVSLPIDYYQLRELFGIKVEEEDIINYYVVDQDNNVVKTIKVDYMTDDITENVEFTVEGENEKLGWYTLCLEVPAVEAEGEANPNTGAESVVGVVAALAVVSVATAAAVSLKK